MALVDYTSSSSEEETVVERVRDAAKDRREKSPSASRQQAAKSLPPLPAPFLDLYATNVRTGTIDDPSLHAGRQRTFPHVEGNWPTHVYIEWWPTVTQRELLNNIIAQVRPGLASPHRLQSHVESDLGTATPLHISLSRPIVLVDKNKDSFREELSETLRKLHFLPFDVIPSQLDWVSNWDATRAFLVLKFAKFNGNKLNGILHAINRVVSKFGQATLYDDQMARSLNSLMESSSEWDFLDFFHVSIASSNTTIRPSSLGQGPSHWGDLNVPCNSIKVKVGNSIDSIELEQSFQDEGGFGRG